MSIKYLQHLAAQELPYRTGNHSELDQIAALQSDDLVVATVPAIDGNGYKGEGVVRLITHKGLEQIQTLRAHVVQT